MYEYAEKVDGLWVGKTPFAFRQERRASIPDSDLENQGLFKVDNTTPEVSATQVAEYTGIKDVDGRPAADFTVRDKTTEELEADLDTARTVAKDDMLNWINEFLRPFTAGTADVEPLSWPSKADASIAHTAGEPHPHDAALLAEIEATGETLAELKAKIDKQNVIYRQIVGFTTGLRRDTIKKIDAAALDEIDDVLQVAKARALTKAQQLGIIE